MPKTAAVRAYTTMENNTHLLAGPPILRADRGLGSKSAHAPGSGGAFAIRLLDGMSNPSSFYAQNERAVVRERRGSVLSRGLVLKVDQRPMGMPRI